MATQESDTPSERMQRILDNISALTVRIRQDRRVYTNIKHVLLGAHEEGRGFVESIDGNFVTMEARAQSPLSVGDNDDDDDDDDAIVNDLEASAVRWLNSLSQHIVSLTRTISDTIPYT